MDTKNNGTFSSFFSDNALISLEVHYASEGTLCLRIDENGADYRMQVTKIPPPYELSKYNGDMPQIESLEYHLKLKKNLIDKLITGMSAIRVPAVPEFTAGISGSTYIFNVLPVVPLVLMTMISFCEKPWARNCSGFSLPP